MLVIHKTSMELRKKFISHRAVWTPFFFVRRELVGSRQVGPFIETPIPEQGIEAQRNILQKELGRPVYEDSEVLVFDVGTLN